MRQNPEKEILPAIRSTGAKQEQRCPRKEAGCTAVALLGMLNETPVPTSGEQATQERATAVSVSAVLHCHLHPLCEGDYSGQDRFEAKSRHLQVEGRTPGQCITP